MEAMSSEKVFSSKGPVRLLSIAVLTYHLSEGQWERSSGTTHNWGEGVFSSATLPCYS